MKNLALKKSCILLLLVSFTLLSSLKQAWVAESQSQPLLIAGSGTNLPITRLLAKAFMEVHSKLKIDIPPSLGSKGGIHGAKDSAITIGLISKPLKPEEMKFGLTVVPYARTAIVIGAHQQVTDTGITYNELLQIYNGEKTLWKDGHEIVVFTREPGDGSNEVLEREIPGFKEAYTESHKAKRWMVLTTDQEMNRLLAKTPYAIGLSDMGAITADQLPIKGLKVNGISPTPENLTKGRYHLVKTLAFVFLKDRLPLGGKAFIDFVKSKEGEKILRVNGYILGE